MSSQRRFILAALLLFALSVTGALAWRGVEKTGAVPSESVAPTVAAEAVAPKVDEPVVAQPVEAKTVEAEPRAETPTVAVKQTREVAASSTSSSEEPVVEKRKSKRHRKSRRWAATEAQSAHAYDRARRTVASEEPVEAASTTSAAEASAATEVTQHAPTTTAIETAVATATATASASASAKAESQAVSANSAPPSKKPDIYLVPDPAPAPLRAPAAPLEPLGLQIYFGVGMNYVAYDENLSEVSTNYRDLRGPAINVGVKMQATDELGVEASYHNTPMRFENSSVSLQTLESSWTSISLEGSYKKKTSKANDLTFLLGTQVHQMPLAMFERVSHQPQMRDIQLVNISAGLRDTYYLNERTRASILGRFQLPVLLSSRTGSSKAESAFMFDGSVGLEKRAFEKAWVGLFWYGQYQRLNFSYHDSVIDTAGTQSALFSDLEFRLTFDF